MSQILIVDDQRSIRNVLEEIFLPDGHKCLKAASGAEALELVESHAVDLVICDIMMEGISGVELLTKLVESHPEIPVIMISGHGSIETAVQCLKLGAVDFIEKPISLNRVLASVTTALKSGKLIQENRTLRKKLNRAKGVTIIGKSPAVQEVLSLIEKVSQTDARVLITGSNGTGKELAARLIHLSGSRANNSFVEVNCAAIPSELVESELFGHEKGSFTGAVKQKKGKFEQAEGGTIFLDEIGDMSLSAQAKVLRALQESKVSRVGSDTDIRVDVRVIAATNKDLLKEIAEGRFREDLYHRLSVIRIEIPALAQRREDIPLLVEHFLKLVCEDQSKPLCTISDEAIELLKQMAWTGNIRELRNCVERLVILSKDPTHISAQDVKLYC